MKMEESKTLKVGDLVIPDGRNKYYGGLVLEIESIGAGDNWCRRVTLKQPHFNGEFRIENYDTRHLKRFEG